MGFLYSACDWAFDRVLPYLPKICERNQRATAFGLGLASGFGAAEFGKSVVFPYFIAPALDNGTDHREALETIEKYCLTATVAAPWVAAAVDKESLDDWVVEKPLYSVGVAGVMLGATARAVIDLYGNR